MFIRLLLAVLLLGLARADTATPSVGKLRSAADQAIAKGDVDKSLKLWNQVIEMEPDNETNYYKRFRLYLRQQKYLMAINDLSSALRIKTNYESALAQRAKLYMRVGKCEEAVQDYNALRLINSNNKDLTLSGDAMLCHQSITQANHHLNMRRYHEARDALNNALRMAESATALFIQRARCSLNLGDYYESIADLGKALKIEGDNIEALEMRGRAYYLLGEFDMAMNHYRKGLQSDPEHKECKSVYRVIKKVQSNQKKAEAAMQAREWGNAVKHWLAMIAADPEHPVFVADAAVELARAYKELQQYDEAKGAVNDILNNRNPNSAPALNMLGQILLDQEQFEEAVQKCKRAVEIDGNNAAFADTLKRAEAALKQSKQKDYYKILAVSRNAESKVIKKAYREMALKWHPDKHTGEEEKAKAEVQFQLVAEAYEILTDEEKRKAYDRGEDVTGNQGGGGGGQGHPFQHFQQQGFQFHFQF